MRELKEAGKKRRKIENKGDIEQKNKLYNERVKEERMSCGKHKNKRLAFKERKKRW